MKGLVAIIAIASVITMGFVMYDSSWAVEMRKNNSQSSSSYSHFNCYDVGDEYKFEMYDANDKHDSIQYMSFNIIDNIAITLRDDKTEDLPMFLTKESIETFGIDSCASILNGENYYNDSYRVTSGSINSYNECKGLAVVNFITYRRKKGSFYCRIENDTLKVSLVEDEGKFFDDIFE